MIIPEHEPLNQVEEQAAFPGTDSSPPDGATPGKRSGVWRADLLRLIRLMCLSLIAFSVVLLGVYGLAVWKDIRDVEQQVAATPEPTAQVADLTVEDTPIPLADMPDEEALADDGLPHDKFFITVERQAYEDAELTLVIPQLDKTLPVYSNVEEDTLRKGVGLYDYAQLPGEGNRNVSIAGHRNTSRGGIITDNAPFYYIDTLSDGDYLYLVDDEYIYRYTYLDEQVVDADDWSVIKSQGFSCLTLTSCTPIGIATHRIVVRGTLDEIFVNSEDFVYQAHSTKMAADNSNSHGSSN